MLGTSTQYCTNTGAIRYAHVPVAVLCKSRVQSLLKYSTVHDKDIDHAIVQCIKSVLQYLI